MNDFKRMDFRTINADYDSIFGHNWPAVPCRRWEYVAAIVFSQILGADKTAKVCDAGSGGYSAFTHYLGNKGYIVDAFDRHASGSQSFANHGKVIYHSMSMMNPKFPDNHFDYVFSMSSIEHINAGKFKIKNLDGDVGDTQSILELCRILKPGGVLLLTTDYGPKYMPPPAATIEGQQYFSHRIYSWKSLLDRLINPAVRKHDMTLWGGFHEDCNWDKIKTIEPMGWGYTEFIFTLRKK
jgi:SAM-dependent methyltransferase